MCCLMLAAICLIGGGCGGCGGCGWGCYPGCYGYGCYPCGYYGCYPYMYGCYPAPPAYWYAPGCYPGGCGYYGDGGYPVGDYFAKAPAAPATARVVVKLPDDARFYIGETNYSLDPKTHTFETPKLQPGQTYEYTLKVEVKRAGQTRTQSKRVMVLAGKETVVEFDDVTTVAAH